MSVTIGLVANVYNEVNAITGWLETHTPFFDDVRVFHSGPGGAKSNDGTIEIFGEVAHPHRVRGHRRRFRRRTYQSAANVAVRFRDVAGR